MKVLITGASGLIGSALVARLAAGGHDVVRLTRSEPRGPDEFRWDPMAGEIDPAALDGRRRDRAPRGRDRRGALDRGQEAAHPRQPRARHAPDRRDRRRAASRGRACSCQRLRDRLLRRSRDEPVTEASPLGDGFLAGVVQDWESAADPARAAGIRVVHPRFGIVQSRRRRGAARAAAAVPARAGRPGRQRPPVRELGRDRRRGRGDRARARRRAPVGPGQRDRPGSRSRTPNTRARSAACCGRPAVLPAPATGSDGSSLGEFAAEVLGGQPVMPERLLRGGVTSSGTPSSRAPCGTSSAATSARGS